MHSNVHELRQVYEPQGVPAPAGGLPACVAFGPFRLYAQERRLMKHDCSVTLGSRSLDILIALLERPGAVISHNELMARAWPGLHVEQSNLRGHVAGLRKALGEDGRTAQYIANVPGRGYCFIGCVSSDRPGLPKEPQLPNQWELVSTLLTSEHLTTLLRDVVREALQTALRTLPVQRE